MNKRKLDTAGKEKEDTVAKFAARYVSRETPSELETVPLAPQLFGSYTPQKTAGYCQTIETVAKKWRGGERWFTKERLRAIHEQLQKKPVKGEKAPIKGLDDHLILWHIVKGDIVTDEEHIKRLGLDSNKYELVLTEPVVGYCTYPYISRPGRDPFEPDDAGEESELYLHPLRIEHGTAIQVKETGDIVKPTLRPYEDLEKSFKEVYDAFCRSAEAKELTTKLSSTPRPKVNKVLAFALGTMSLKDSSATLYHHAILLALQAFFCVDCFAQDQRYLKDDKTLLESLGEHEKVKVVTEPEGWLMLDESSVLYAHTPNIPVKAITVDLVQPAIIIWKKVSNQSDKVR